MSRSVRRRRGGTARLGDVVSTLLQRRRYARPMQREEAEAAWSRAADPLLRERSRVASYRDGVLTVEVGSDAEKYELEAFRVGELTAALGGDADAPPVKKLVFRVGHRRS